jgi:hypothetical protein
VPRRGAQGQPLSRVALAGRPGMAVRQSRPRVQGRARQFRPRTCAAGPRTCAAGPRPFPIATQPAARRRAASRAFATRKSLPPPCSPKAIRPVCRRCRQATNLSKRDLPADPICRRFLTDGNRIRVRAREEATDRRNGGRCSTDGPLRGARPSTTTGRHAVEAVWPGEVEPGGRRVPAHLAFFPTSALPLHRRCGRTSNSRGGRGTPAAL